MEGERWQVKKIHVKRAVALSLQMHHHRAEHWVVVQGTASVEKDGDPLLLSENQSVYIPWAAVIGSATPVAFPWTHRSAERTLSGGRRHCPF